MKFNCPNCNEAMRVTEKMLGKSGRCRGCDQRITIPKDFPAQSQNTEAKQLNQATESEVKGRSMPATMAMILVPLIVLAIGCIWFFDSRNDVGTGEVRKPTAVVNEKPVVAEKLVVAEKPDVVVEATEPSEVRLPATQPKADATGRKSVVGGTNGPFSANAEFYHPSVRQMLTNREDLDWVIKWAKAKFNVEYQTDRFEIAERDANSFKLVFLGDMVLRLNRIGQDYTCSVEAPMQSGRFGTAFSLHQSALAIVSGRSDAIRRYEMSKAGDALINGQSVTIRKHGIAATIKRVGDAHVTTFAVVRPKVPHYSMARWLVGFERVATCYASHGNAKDVAESICKASRLEMMMSGFTLEKDLDCYSGETYRSEVSMSIFESGLDGLRIWVTAKPKSQKLKFVDEDFEFIRKLSYFILTGMDESPAVEQEVAAMLKATAGSGEMKKNILGVEFNLKNTDGTRRWTLSVDDSTLRYLQKPNP